MRTRVLCVFEAPGPMTNAGNKRPGSGFISADNNDETMSLLLHSRDDDCHSGWFWLVSFSVPDNGSNTPRGTEGPRREIAFHRGFFFRWAVHETQHDAGPRGFRQALSSRARAFSLHMWRPSRRLGNDSGTDRSEDRWFSVRPGPSRSPRGGWVTPTFHASSTASLLNLVNRNMAGGIWSKSAKTGCQPWKRRTREKRQGRQVTENLHRHRGANRLLHPVLKATGDD